MRSVGRKLARGKCPEEGANRRYDSNVEPTGPPSLKSRGTEVTNQEPISVMVYSQWSPRARGGSRSGPERPTGTSIACMKMQLAIAFPSSHSELTVFWACHRVKFRLLEAASHQIWDQRRCGRIAAFSPNACYNARYHLHRWSCGRLCCLRDLWSSDYCAMRCGK